MNNVLQEIAKWAEELPFWEQAALDKVLSQKDLDEVDFSELLQYLLEDAQLVEKTSKRQMLRFQQGLYASLDNRKPVVLKEISQLTNVNALVPDQRLTFGQQLTAIFGRNGSGKSGYARILGCAGFTRGDTKILPDVTKPYDKDQPLTALITVISDGKEKTIEYKAGESCQDLSSFYVFDSTSVKVHMTGKNTFSFSPAGLSVLTELGRVTDEVREQLRKKIEEKEKPAEFEKYFSGESEIKQLIESLGADTDPHQLRKLANLTASELRRIDELNVAIGQIGLDRYQEEIKQKEQQYATLQSLYDWLDQANKLLSDQSIEEANEKIADYQALEKRAQQLSSVQFKHPRFTQTGTDVWDEFVRVAKKLSEAESSERQYPEIGDPCLLCQQPLSKEAQQLILNLWEYLAGEVRTEFDQEDAKIISLNRDLHDPDNFDLDENLAPALDLLKQVDRGLHSRLIILVDSYRQRGQKLDKGLLEKRNIESLASLPEDLSYEVKKYLDRLSVAIRSMKEEDPEEKRKNLESERRVLEHRKKLGELLPDIEAYIDARIWARSASQIGGSTRHITVKYNQLFKQLVEKRYLEIFKQTLQDLGRPLQVDIETSGKKGETVKQIVLRTHSTAKSIADPEKVLSEGEKRAVALADFLTEVALDTTSSGIILDDPVTSLDLDWRKTIADILAKEAQQRQVVVFTHDKPFLYLLIHYIDELQISYETHWIKRGDYDDRPGYVWLHNCPALESTYKKPTLAEDCYKEAKDKAPQHQERVLKDGFGALRSTYEAFIVFELLNGAVMRFEERISFGSLKTVAWDSAIVNEIVETCERLSRYIEGHLHSDAFDTVAELSPKLLRAEIDKFYDVRKRLRDLKN